MIKRNFDTVLTSLQQLLPKDYIMGRVEAYRDVRKVDNLVFRVEYDEIYKVKVSLERVEFNTKTGTVTIATDGNAYKSIHTNRATSDLHRAQFRAEASRAVKTPEYLKKITLEDVNDLIRENKKARALIRRTKALSNKKLIKDFGTRTIPQEINALYRSGRQSGMFKKNATIVREKLDKFLRTSVYKGQIEIIDASMESYNMRMIDFGESEYLIVILTNNKNPGVSETVLLRLRDKTDITEMIAAIRGYDLLRVKGYSKDKSLYTNFADLYRKTIQVKMDELNKRSELEIGMVINQRYLKMEITLKKINIPLRLSYFITPTNSGVELQTNLNNAKKITAITKEIANTPSYSGKKEDVMVELIYDIENTLSSLTLTKVDMETPVFSSVKQLVTWLKLKKIEIIF